MEGSTPLSINQIVIQELTKLQHQANGHRIAFTYGKVSKSYIF